MLQIHTQQHTKTCGPDHVLRLSSQDMADVFITSMAELPGLLIAAVLIDVLGRKKCVLRFKWRFQCNMCNLPLLAFLHPNSKSPVQDNDAWHAHHCCQYCLTYDLYVPQHCQTLCFQGGIYGRLHCSFHLHPRGVPLGPSDPKFINCKTGDLAHEMIIL